MLSAAKALSTNYHYYHDKENLPTEGTQVKETLNTVS